METRRQLIKWGAVVGLGTFTISGEALFIKDRATASVSTPQTALAGSSIPQFQDPLPTFVGNRVADTSIQVRMQAFQQKILPSSIYSALKSPYTEGTYIWGYQVGDKPASYPGYSIEAMRGMPTTVTYVNNLSATSSAPLEKLLTVDQTIHWADPLRQMGATTPYTGLIPTAVHLHGAEVLSHYDGGPTQWFTADGKHGAGYKTYAPTVPNATVYHYPNSQPSTTLWFHDHALGITRLNIYSGLAAFYLVRDHYDSGTADNPLRLPAGPQEIELLIQDRQFDTNGQLLFPDGMPAGLSGAPSAPHIHPYWNQDFFGDVIVINGKSWPYLEVQPRRYRFRLLNGSNDRWYQLYLANASDQSAGPAFWQIGTDGGLLDKPVQLNESGSSSSTHLALGPAERADIIIDFANLSGKNFTLMNVAPFPFPNGASPVGTPMGSVMQFRVNQPLSGQDTTYDPARGAPLRGESNQPPAIVRLADASKGTLASGVTASVKRQLTLIAPFTSAGLVELLLNNTKWSGLSGGTTKPVAGSQPDKDGQGIYLTELPKLGSTEVWEIVNLIGVAHPIHIHLIQFQLINRQAINTRAYRAVYNAAFPGGTFGGVTSSGKWGMVQYRRGTLIPGYGPPLAYNTANADGALGGNPAFGSHLQGGIILPNANEAGWKDTILMLPNQVTRLAIRWAPTETAISDASDGKNLFSFDPATGPGYVWHCHILDHEDNEMMRPFIPVP